MRILQTTIGLSATGHIVTATDVAKAPTVITCSCHHCGCPLTLCNGGGFLPPWFEHNQNAYPMAKLQTCPHVDPEGQESAQMKAMRQLVRGIQPVPAVQQWHCAMCNTDYGGAKHCVKCNTGIYSTEVNQSV